MRLEDLLMAVLNEATPSDLKNDPIIHHVGGMFAVNGVISRHGLMSSFTLSHATTKIAHGLPSNEYRIFITGYGESLFGPTDAWRKMPREELNKILVSHARVVISQSCISIVRPFYLYTANNYVPLQSSCHITGLPYMERKDLEKLLDETPWD